MLFQKILIRGFEKADYEFLGYSTTKSKMIPEEGGVGNTSKKFSTRISEYYRFSSTLVSIFGHTYLFNFQTQIVICHKENKLRSKR